MARNVTFKILFLETQPSSFLARNGFLNILSLERILNFGGSKRGLKIWFDSIVKILWLETWYGSVVAPKVAPNASLSTYDGLVGEYDQHKRLAARFSFYSGR